MKKRGGYHTAEGAEEEKVGKSVVERCISTPIPNYLSTYQLNQLYYSLFGEYDGAGGVEMRGLEEVWKACGGVHLDNNA